MSPFKSDDLSEIVVPAGEGFAVLRSSDAAEHDSDYRELA
jgi:prefoldin subunit 5